MQNKCIMLCDCLSTLTVWLYLLSHERNFSILSDIQNPNPNPLLYACHGIIAYHFSYDHV